MFFAYKHAVHQVPSSLVSKAQKDNVIYAFHQITGANELLVGDDIESAVKSAIDYIEGVSQAAESNWKCII